MEKRRQYDRFNPTPAQAKVQAEINANRIFPISFGIFKKSPSEKMKLATAKASHKYLLKAYGYNPARTMNVPVNKAGDFVRSEK